MFRACSALGKRMDNRMFRREPTGTSKDFWHSLRVALVVGPCLLVVILWVVKL